MAERATKKLKKRTDKTQSENLKLAKKLEKLQKDKKKCETERFSNVDRFMAGELEKDDYLRVRQELTKEIVDVFIDRILIYDPKHIEIQWKLPDEVIKFIEG